MANFPPDTTGNSPFTTTIRFPSAPVATAGNDLDTPACIAPHSGTITSVNYITPSALTGANTNSRTVSVLNKTQSLTPATLAFTSGVSTVAFTAKNITLGNAANVAVIAGDVLDWNSLHVGTGLADPGGLVEITITRSATEGVV
ncbi:MAG TPA: hypothetical protein VGM92_08790 [Candidatus Kapabacteria bacterium]|jgi:hypothetical protein